MHNHIVIEFLMAVCNIKSFIYFKDSMIVNPKNSEFKLKKMISSAFMCKYQSNINSVI
jgi:hypothetical protein